MKKDIKLDCGIKAEYWEYNGKEHIDICIDELYNGYSNEKTNDFLVLSKLFKELYDKGYSGSGISVSIGYYDSIDGMTLRATKKITKK